MYTQISSKKRLTALLVAFAFLLGTFAVGTETVSAASKLKVSPTRKTVYVGSKVTIKANKKVKWSVSGKKKIVKIVSKKSKKNKKVTVKAYKAGTAYVKVKYGKKTKKIRITVRSKVPTKINVVSTETGIGVGNHCTVKVKSVSPSYASKSVTWSSSNTKIATVNASGLVKGIKPGVATITATSKMSKAKKGSVKIRVLKTLSGTVTMTTSVTDETKFPKGKVTRVWIPIPQTDRDQTVAPSTIQCKAEKATEGPKETVDSSGNKAFYVVWDENTEPKDRTVTLTYNISRREIVRPDNMASLEKGEVDTKEMAPYLRETGRSGSLTDGIVKETADKIVKDAEAKTVYQKAYAIYEWVCENISRDTTNSTPGIGAGNVEYILEHPNRGGKCTDTNSVFIALCRAAGVPARGVYGLSLNELGGETKTYIQKCKPQYYLPGYGWAEADTSAVLKEIIKHEDEYRGKDASPEMQEEWKNIKDRYWGNGSEQWIMLSTGDDIELSPRQNATTAEDKYPEILAALNNDGTLNYFVYPYVEYDGAFNWAYNRFGKEPSHFTYNYTFEEDAGCNC